MKSTIKDSRPLHTIPGWRVGRDGTIYNSDGVEVRQHEPGVRGKNCRPVVYFDTRRSDGARRTQRRSATALYCEAWHDVGCPCAQPAGWRWDREHPFRDQSKVQPRATADNLRAARERWKRKGTIL